MVPVREDTGVGSNSDNGADEHDSAGGINIGFKKNTMSQFQMLERDEKVHERHIGAVN